MKVLVTDRTAFDRRSGALFGVLLLLTGSAALAQTGPPPDRPPAAAESSAKDQPPPGACKPIGLTVSGEVVFPLECRDFIERQKAVSRRPPPETKSAPTAAEAKPLLQDDRPTGSTNNAAAVEDKPAPEI